MARLPDLVRDSKLETLFLTDGGFETVHIFHEPDPSSRQRVVSRSEHWRRQRRIGGGGFGKVYLERCTKGGRDDVKVRAVKEIDIDSHCVRINYNSELEAIAKFSHRKYERCFVKSFGWYESPKSLFIAMEFLELGDLHAYLYHKPPLSEHMAKKIIYQILDGLNLMHENEFAHRDLKPKNILLKSCPPDEWWVKIADFGLSKRTGDGLGMSATLKGTIGYIAPELYGFTKKGNPYACDIWATGEIAFQMLTKQPTFKDLESLSSYVEKPETFPSNQLFAVQASQLGVEFIISLMSPTPGKRISAKDALWHRWIGQSFPYHCNSVSADPHYKAIHTTSVIDSTTEEFVTWNTIKSSEAPGIPKNIEEFRALPLQTTGKKMTRRSSTYNATSNSSDSIPVASVFDDKMARPLDPITRNPHHESEGHTKSTQTVTFSLDSKQLTPESNDDIVGLWVPTTAGERCKFKHHQSGVNTVAFSPDGKLLASGSSDGKVRLWDPNTGMVLHDPDRGILLHALMGHTDWVQAVAFSPDGKLLASASGDMTIRLWNLATRTNLYIKGHGKAVWAVTFSPSGKLLASASDDMTVRIWDTNTGTVLHILNGHTDWVRAVTFSPDGKLLASASGDMKVRVWDPNRGIVLHALIGHTDWVQAVTFSPDGKLLASASGDRKVRVWDPKTGVNTYILRGHGKAVWAVTFSPDGKLLASASGDMTIRLWDTNTGSVLHILKGHTDWVQAVTFSSDGKLLASTSRDRTVRVWDPTTSIVFCIFKGHTDKVRAVAFSPDGKLLASASNDATVRIWGFVGSNPAKKSRKLKLFG